MKKRASHRFLDFSLSDTMSDAKTYPQREQDRFTQPQNNQGWRRKDRDDLGVGTGTNDSSDFKSVQNVIPPRGTPR